MQHIVAELKELWPDASQGVLGSHDVLRHRDETPAHKFESVIKLVSDKRLVELTARDSFDDVLGTFLLDSIEEAELPALGSKRICVYATNFPNPWSFECVVVVPPKIAERFDHESARLKRMTYWVVPAFAYEFRHGEGGDGFWCQMRRRDGWRVDVMNWHRSKKVAPRWD